MTITTILGATMATIAQLPRVRSRFHIITPRPAPDVVAIIDLYDECELTMSVTNDAERVVDYIRMIGVLRAGDRLIYRDTEQRWDEILLNDDITFAGFAPIGASAIQEAVSGLKTK